MSEYQLRQISKLAALRLFFVLVIALQLASSPVLAAGKTGRYSVDPQQSVIHIYTGKAGIMRRFGHRHIISAVDISGDVFFQPGADSYARLVLTPESFVVDEPAARAAAGKPFQSDVKEDDRLRTRKNMLSDALLDVKNYPEIKVDIELANYDGDMAEFDIGVHLKDQAFSFRIPGALAMEGGTLRASATFDLDHKEIGLKPFSAAGGAIRVAKKLHFDVRILAYLMGEAPS